MWAMDYQGKYPDDLESTGSDRYLKINLAILFGSLYYYG